MYACAAACETIRGTRFASLQKLAIQQNKRLDRLVHILPKQSVNERGPLEASWVFISR